MLRKITMACLLTLFSASPFLNAEAARVGRLENGFRYAIYPQAELKDVHCALLIEGGSLMEDDGQSGLAAFVTHFQKRILSFILSMDSAGATLTHELTATSTLFASTLPNEDAWKASGFPVMCASLFSGETLVPMFGQEVSDLWEAAIVDEGPWLSGDAHNERTLLSLLNLEQLSQHPCSYTVNKNPNLSVGDFRAFCDRLYRVDQAALLILGPVEADELEATIQEAFSAIPSPSTPKRAWLTPTPQLEEISVIQANPESDHLSFYVTHIETEPSQLLRVSDQRVLEIDESALAMRFFRDNLQYRLFNLDNGSWVPPACLAGQERPCQYTFGPMELWSWIFSLYEDDMEMACLKAELLNGCWQHLMAPMTPAEYAISMGRMKLSEATDDPSELSLFDAEDLFSELQALFFAGKPLPETLGNVGPYFGLQQADSCEPLSPSAVFSSFTLEDLNYRWLDWMDGSEFSIRVDVPESWGLEGLDRVRSFMFPSSGDDLD